jgi:hypothetical protein
MWRCALHALSHIIGPREGLQRLDESACFRHTCTIRIRYCSLLYLWPDARTTAPTAQVPACLPAPTTHAHTLSAAAQLVPAAIPASTCTVIVPYSTPLGPQQQRPQHPEKKTHAKRRRDQPEHKHTQQHKTDHSILRKAATSNNPSPAQACLHAPCTDLRVAHRSVLAKPLLMQQDPHSSGLCSTGKTSASSCRCQFQATVRL